MGGGCGEVLYAYTVWHPIPENTMAASLRQHYRPTRDRTPAWLRRIWLWF
jgi:hypothetical protein